MQYTPAVEEFVTCLKRSGLVAEASVDTLIADLAKAGVDITDPKKIAAALLRNKTLTKWQAQNLLRGKRRGFTLGKYRLLGLLGKGANSSVYEAEHSLMHRRCAIKVLPVKSRSSSGLPQFQREARAVAQLDHSNIVRGYDLGQEKDGKTVLHFFVMELVDGESFEERVARDGPLSAVDAANLIRQAADGLAHAHAAGIIHRDIKPANLLVDRQGVVKILDLGLAKISDLLSTDETPVLGTADFLPPEQAVDAKQADARSDIYSLGCTFYFILCGQVPFSGGTLSERMVRHVFEKPVPLADKRPELPESLTAVVEKMLAKDPDDRIQTCAEVQTVLRNWLLNHADKNWLRAHPAILNAGREDETPESLAPVANNPAPRRPTKAAPPPPIEGSGDGYQLVPVIEPPSSAEGFLDSHEFDIPISPVTRSLMKNHEHTTWRTWLARASKRFRRE